MPTMRRTPMQIAKPENCERFSNLFVYIEMLQTIYGRIHVPENHGQNRSDGADGEVGGHREWKIMDGLHKMDAERMLAENGAVN